MESVHLTERTDLALRLLLYLAVEDGSVRVPVARIARAFDASPAHLAKVSQALAHAGFLDTATGRAGGVRLARPATEIRVGAVVRAIEPFELVTCFVESGRCSIAGVCGLAPALETARDAFLAVLDEITLATAAARRDAMRARLDLVPPGRLPRGKRST